MHANLAQQFSQPLLTWFDSHGRKDLPWQHPRTPYQVWVSEIMLQQTQVQTVIPYFLRFMQSFPHIEDLAQASDDTVMAHWAGLGYYSRARNLHKTAKIIYHDYHGIFPQTLETLSALPGIGPSTAAAILAQAFHAKAAILDANVKRVLTRYFTVAGWPEQSTVKKQLWQLADACMPEERCADYTQAIMDLGASCCTAKKPQCPRCPVQSGCRAFLHNSVAEYPHKKAKKALPVRHQQFLVLYDAGKKLIYLEKNPPSGLWGSLWCLPNLELEEDTGDAIKQKYGYNTCRVEHLTDIKHSFSHFHLYIKAKLVHIQQESSVRELPGRWMHALDALSLGLAKPIKDIIKQLLFYNQAM